jgi:ATP-binding cassette, subfamily B (MDR/TAP), member 1
MLERFYDPQEGSIQLDGQEIKNLNLTDMRRHIGYVSQEPILFNTSIRENLLFAKPDATEGEIIEALKDANAWDFITKKFATGLDTMVGSGGGQLSGGQK